MAKPFLHPTSGFFFSPPENSIIRESTTRIPFTDEKPNSRAPLSLSAPRAAPATHRSVLYNRANRIGKWVSRHARTILSMKLAREEGKKTPRRLWMPDSSVSWKKVVASTSIFSAVKANLRKKKKRGEKRRGGAGEKKSTRCETRK